MLHEFRLVSHASLQMSSKICMMTTACAHLLLFAAHMPFEQLLGLPYLSCQNPDDHQMGGNSIYSQMKRSVQRMKGGDCRLWVLLVLKNEPPLKTVERFTYTVIMHRGIYF